MKQLFGESKRCSVYQVAMTCAAVAFVTLKAARLIFPATTLGGLYDELAVLAFVGFPSVLVVAGGGYRTGGGGESEPAVGDNSVAALTFDALGQAEPDTFTAGMRDDPVPWVSDVSALRVIPRSLETQLTPKETNRIERRPMKDRDSGERTVGCTVPGGGA